MKNHIGYIEMYIFDGLDINGINELSNDKILFKI